MNCNVRKLIEVQDGVIEPCTQYIKELETRIEAMKCCGNCGQEFGTHGKCFYFDCKHGYVGTTDDNWQLAEKRGE